MTEQTLEPRPIDRDSRPRFTRAALAFIFATVFFDTLGFGIIIPVYPQLIASFVNGNYANAAIFVAEFNAVWAAMQFLFAPLIGALSDKVGRRPVLILSALGLGADYIVMALAPNLNWLFLGRIVSGITSASFTVSFAYVADVTPGEKRAGAYGMIGSIWGVGFIIGPLIGGLLGTLGPRFPFWGAAAFSITSAIYGLFVLRESLPHENRRPLSLTRSNPIGALLAMKVHRGLLGYFGVNFLNFLAFQVLPTVYVLYAASRYGWGPDIVGIALALVGACNIIVQGLFVRRTVTRFGERTTLLIGLVSGIVGFVIWGLASDPITFMIAIIFYAPIGFVQPAVQGLMTRKVGPTEQGALQGINGSIMALTGILGPFIFGFLYFVSIGMRSPSILLGAPFLLSALLMTASLALAIRVMRNVKLTPASPTMPHSGYANSPDSDAEALG